MSSSTKQVVYTNKAHCRDCYRCLRVCPVKAIRMENGQAYVVAERCISCGTCIRECPQGAKTFRNDVERAARLLASGGFAAASIAPSFVAAFNEWERKRLPSALRKLGFSYIGETAIGAYQVAMETARFTDSQKNKAHVCTACPAVVSYIERYKPENVDLLVPIVSPMLAHARHIRERVTSDQLSVTSGDYVIPNGVKELCHSERSEESALNRGSVQSRSFANAQDDIPAPDTRHPAPAKPDPKSIIVIFIGPCVAKKAEAERPENAGLVDCVLTFSELMEWFEREGIDLSTLEESGFSEEPEGDARFFPLVGGSIRTSEMSTDMLASEVVSASGFMEVQEVLASLRSGGPVVVEPLFCPQGCVNGPAMTGTHNVYQRRSDVLQYADSHPGPKPEEARSYFELRTRFRPEPIMDAEITEEEIREVLEKTGKAAPENQLNCGACGYPSCREKAVAVIRGMAELEMCIPYMKRLAEQRTDRIIETSPNGIVILDERLNIIGMNPAFRSFFMCSEAVLGKPISYLMDPDPFEKLASGASDLVNTVVTHGRYNLVCHEILYALPEENQFVGIFVNITKTRADEEKLDKLRSQTIVQARELLEHQIHMAQTIAKYLGTSTAQSEGLLEKLMLLAGDENVDQGGDGKLGMEWIKDIYTSK